MKKSKFIEINLPLNLCHDYLDLRISVLEPMRNGLAACFPLLIVQLKEDHLNSDFRNVTTPSFLLLEHYNDSIGCNSDFKRWIIFTVLSHID